MMRFTLVIRLIIAMVELIEVIVEVIKTVLL